MNIFHRQLLFCYIRRIPGRIELSEKSSNEIDFTEKSDEDDLKTEQCFDLEKPVEIGFLNGPKRFFNYEKKIRNGFADSGKFNIVRCRRRIQSWNRQEPVYVEEPRWIVIDLHAENSEGGFINEEDPFYVARGKKSSRNSQISLLPDEDHSHNSRKKRNAYGEAFRRSLFDANNPMILRELRTELEPRDKNSDLLYILNEPFFISRGKKNGARTERYVWKNRYAKVLANFESKTDPYLPRASRTMVSSGSRAETLAHRDRRGVMEDLLKKNDPFYLARGKKSLIDVSEEFQNLLLSNSKAFKKSTEFARFSTEKENQ